MLLYANESIGDDLAIGAAERRRGNSSTREIGLGERGRSRIDPFPFEARLTGHGAFPLETLIPRKILSRAG